MGLTGGVGGSCLSRAQHTVEAAVMGFSFPSSVIIRRVTGLRVLPGHSILSGNLYPPLL